MTYKQRLILWWSLALALLGMLSAKGQVPIYANDVNDLTTRFWPGTNEIGNQILFGDRVRWVTDASFEFFCVSNSATGPNVRYRYYLNDGTNFNGYATPGTMLYDSGWFGPLPVTDRSTVNYSYTTGDFPKYTGLWLGDSNGVPYNSITWTAQFDQDGCGLDVYSPPVMGYSYPDYWWFEDGQWYLKRNTNGVSLRFASKISAIGAPLDRPTLTNYTTVDYGMVLQVLGNAHDYQVQASPDGVTWTNAFVAFHYVQYPVTNYVSGPCMFFRVSDVITQ